MGRYSNYQYALILSLAGYGLPMLLVSLYLFYNKRNRSVLTIGGSLAKFYQSIFYVCTFVYIHFINLFLCLYFCFYVTVTSQFDKSQK